MKETRQFLAGLLAVAAMTVTASAASWTSMDYRAPGLAYSSTNWPTTNTDYSLLWRASRQARAEAVAFVTAEHERNGAHKDGFLQPAMIPAGLFSNGLFRIEDLYFPGTFPTNYLTNLVYNWNTNTQPVSSTADGKTFEAETNCIYRTRIIAGGGVVAGGTNYTNGDTVTVEGGTCDEQATLDVHADGGVVDYFTVNAAGAYSVLPADMGNVTVSGGTGGGLVVDLSSAYEEFKWHGPFTNVAAGSIFQLSRDGSNWTGTVESVAATYLTVTATTNSPWSNTATITWAPLDTITTNLQAVSTWQPFITYSNSGTTSTVSVSNGDWSIGTTNVSSYGPPFTNRVLQNPNGTRRAVEPGDVLYSNTELIGTIASVLSDFSLTLTSGASCSGDISPIETPQTAWVTNYNAPPVAPTILQGYGSEILEVKEWTVLLGQNGLKLWIKTITWQSAYAAADWGLWPPYVAMWGDGLKPPMSNVFALVVKEMGCPGAQYGATWLPGESRLMTPAVASMIGPGHGATNWPAAFGVRQYFGQLTPLVVASGSFSLTGGFVCIAVGQ